MLDEATRGGLLRRGGRRHFAPGEVIFSRGDAGDTIFVIEAGRVEISRTSLGGRRSVLNHMGPGETLGEIAMLDEGDRSADATAATEVTLIAVSRSAFMDHLAQNPRSMMALVSELCARVRHAVDMYEDQSQVVARTRLARCLTRIAEKWGRPGEDGAVRIGEQLSQSDLGEFSGLARENVNRHLKALIQEEIIRLEDGAILIADPDALREIAEL